MPVSNKPLIESNCGSMVPIAILGLLAAGAGILHQNALALTFGLPLFLGPALLHAILWRSLRAIRIDRHVVPAVFEGDSVEVTVRLRNSSRWPVFYPSVADVFTPEFHASKVTLFPYRVLAGETVEEIYRGKCLLPRGIFRIGPGLVSVSDPFGWIQLRKTLPARSTLKVYPRVLDLGVRERVGTTVLATRDDQAHHRYGDSMEFFSVRDYRTGDPPRRIHWPLSAHRGFPVVREFMQHSTGNMTVFLDLCRDALVGVGRGSSLEHAIKIGVALANRALRAGHDVQLLARSGHGDLRLTPARGPEQLKRLLDLVIRMRPDGDMDLPRLWRRHLGGLRRGETVVYPVSPYLFRSSAFFRDVQAMRRRGLRQVAAVVDERTFRALRYEESASESQATRVVERLRSLGVESYLVSCGVPLETVFRGGAP